MCIRVLLFIFTQTAQHPFNIKGRIISCTNLVASHIGIIVASNGVALIVRTNFLKKRVRRSPFKFFIVALLGLVFSLWNYWVKRLTWLYTCHIFVFPFISITPLFLFMEKWHDSDKISFLLAIFFHLFFCSFSSCVDLFILVCVFYLFLIPGDVQLSSTRGIRKYKNLIYYDFFLAHFIFRGSHHLKS